MTQLIIMANICLYPDHYLSHLKMLFILLAPEVIEKKKSFYDDKDKKTFIQKLEETFQKYDITGYAYCLMDNHYHLFIKTAQPNISLVLPYLNTSYANWFPTR